MLNWSMWKLIKCKSQFRVCRLPFSKELSSWWHPGLRIFFTFVCYYWFSFYTYISSFFPMLYCRFSSTTSLGFSLVIMFLEMRFRVWFSYSSPFNNFWTNVQNKIFPCLSETPMSCSILLAPSLAFESTSSIMRLFLMLIRNYVFFTFVNSSNFHVGILFCHYWFFFVFPITYR